MEPLPEQTMCFVRAHCQICLFPIQKGEKIKLGLDENSYEMRFQCRLSLLGDERGHMSLSPYPEWDPRPRTVILQDCAHSECVNYFRKSKDIQIQKLKSADFYKASSFDFIPLDTSSREKYVEKVLIEGLQNNTNRNPELPEEVRRIIARYLMYVYGACVASAITAKEQGRKPLAASKSRPVDPHYVPGPQKYGEAVYVSYTKLAGRRYVRNITIGGKGSKENLIGTAAHLALPALKDRGFKAVRLFIAEDELGVRQINFVRSTQCKKWCNRSHDVEGAWWSHILLEDFNSKQLAVSRDAWKVRKVRYPKSQQHKTRYVWAQPVLPVPRIRYALLDHSLGWTFRMVFLKINLTSVGYWVATDRLGRLVFLERHDKASNPVKNIVLHRTPKDKSIIWTYMPMNKGEYLTQICRRSWTSFGRGRSVAHSNMGITLSTNRKRTVVFGLYNPIENPKISLRRVDFLPRIGRLWFNALDPENGIELVYSMALKSSKSNASQKNLPALPRTLSPCPAKTNSGGWFFSSCTMADVTEIRICRDRYMRGPDRPIIGMILKYSDDHRESVGQFRPQDYSSDHLRVTSGIDRIWMRRRKQMQENNFCLAIEDIIVQESRPKSYPGSWFELPQFGILEWWHGGNIDQKLYYRGTGCHLYHDGNELDSFQVL